MKQFVKLTLILWCVFFQLVAETDLQPTVTLMIPMRDGLCLPTDIYSAHPDTKNLPCILIRSPSDRKRYAEVYVDLIHHGYVIAIQDTRSGIDKEGKTFPYFTDGWGPLQDGYDTVEWLAKSPYSNGKVATMGFSAMGITQLMMAPAAPPSLQCQYICMAASNLYHHGIMQGGQLFKSQIEGWLGRYAKDPSVLGHLLNQKENLLFWQMLDSVSKASQVNVPAIHYGGWYDTFSEGTLDAFVSRQEQGSEGARGKQKLIMGPWTHPFTVTKFDFPDQAKHPPFDISPAVWFNYHLKGEENEIGKLPNVIYYVMGPLDGTRSSGNVWKTSDQWPVPATPTSLYLGARGKLLKEAEEQPSRFTYLYDPQNPVPTLGGRNLFLEAGPMDQRPIEARSDVLVFSTDPLEQDLEVTGRIFAKLFLASNRDTTDLAIRLTDVYPDGKSLLIADGISKVKTAPHEVTPVEIDLWSTSLVFAKGHRIRVSVTSSNYPRFERNTNHLEDYLGPPLIAENILFTGKQYPSSIQLPVRNQNL